MIDKWKLYNFKSIRIAELDLSPLTIFAGANSSGKSTFLQSILLVSQTLASRVASQTVVLNGHLAKLGQFDDLRNAGSDLETIRISWDLSLPPQRADYAPYMRSRSSLDKVSCDIAFGVPRRGGTQAQQLNPKLYDSLFSCVAISSSEEGPRITHSVRATAKPQSEEPEDSSPQEASRPSTTVL